MEQHRDDHIVCASCGTSFLFSAGEAAVFAERGLASPKRCKECRRARKEQQQGQLGGGGGGFRGPAGNGGGYQGPPRGDFHGNAPRGRSPRYTGDVNEYRSPMQDNSYGAQAPAPAWRTNGYAPRPAPQARGGGGGGGGFRGAPPQWRGDGNFRAPQRDFPRDDFQGQGFQGQPFQGQGFQGPPNDRGPGPQQPRRRPPQEMFQITCNSCGVHAEVPFRPAEGRDVFCQACYRARKPIAT